MAAVTYASATGANANKSVGDDGPVAVGDAPGTVVPMAVGVDATFVGFEPGVGVFVGGTEVGGVDEVVKQLRVPESVNVLPGSGTNCQS